MMDEKVQYECKQFYISSIYVRILTFKYEVQYAYSRSGQHFMTTTGVESLLEKQMTCTSHYKITTPIWKKFKNLVGLCSLLDSF